MTTLTETEEALRRRLIHRLARDLDIPPALLDTPPAYPHTQVADSFLRDGNMVTVQRDADGQFDDGLGDAVQGLVTVINRDLVAGQSIVAFDDDDGEYLDTPGRGVAFRDADELGEMDDGGDIHSAAVFSAADAPKVADALGAAAVAARAQPSGPGMQRAAAMTAGGVHVAAFHDGDGEWGEPGTGYVAVAYADDEPPWDDPEFAASEGISYDLFEADEADDLAEAVRAAAGARGLTRSGIPRKKDRLGLDGRILLDPGERLTGSASIDTESSWFNPLVASTAGLKGPRLRFGLNPDSDNDAAWQGNPDGNTTLLDAAGFAELQAAMDGVAARADRQRAEYAKRTEPIAQRADAIDDELKDLFNSVFDGTHKPSDADIEKAMKLEDRARYLTSTRPEIQRYNELHRQRSALDRKYLRYEEGERFPTSLPMSAEDKAERDRLTDEIAELHEANPRVSEADDLRNAANRIMHSGRPFTEEEEARIAALQQEKHDIWNNPDVPDPDEVIEQGIIPAVSGEWGDLRYTVTGSDSDWEDNPTGRGTWNLAFDVIPRGAGVDHERDDDLGDRLEAQLGPGELKKVMRAMAKVYNMATEGTQTAAVAYGRRRHKPSQFDRAVEQLGTLLTQGAPR